MNNWLEDHFQSAPQIYLFIFVSKKCSWIELLPLAPMSHSTSLSTKMSDSTFNKKKLHMQRQATIYSSEPIIFQCLSHLFVGQPISKYFWSAIVLVGSFLDWLSFPEGLSADLMRQFYLFYFFVIDLMRQFKASQLWIFGRNIWNKIHLY